MNRSPWLCLVVVGLCLSGINGFGQHQKVTIEPGKEFLIYFPPGYSGSQDDFPVLFFLHGGQGIENGIDNLPYGPPKLIDDGEWPADRDLIVVSPYLPRDPSIPNKNNQEWPAAFVDDFISYVKSHYSRIDENRIYLSGISLGAKGAWDYTIAHPDNIATMVPISGTAEIEDICDMKEVPVWALHGAGDPIVDPEGHYDGRYGSKVVTEAINSCTPAPEIPARLTLLNGVRHENWTEYYDLSAGFDLYQWMMRHINGSTDNIIPFVDAGGPDLKVLSPSSIIINGGVHDSDGSVANLLWTKESGPDVTMENTTTPALHLSDLNTGEYSFKLTATDDEGGMDEDLFGLEVVNSIDEGAVTGLKLFSGTTGTEIKDLQNNDMISIHEDQLFYIEASTESTVASVRFGVDENRNNETDKASPYYFGSTTKETQMWSPSQGTYLITATPFRLKNPYSDPGISLRYQIEVTEDPLPVEFLKVEATATPSGIQITWSTASEVNNDYFTVEHSQDVSKGFKTLKKVTGAGNSDVVLDYEYKDTNPAEGLNYYRIRQTDFDGRHSYSPVVSTAFQYASSGVNIFPNPAPGGKFQMTIKNRKDTPLHITLYNTTGHIVEQQIMRAPDNGSIKFSPSERLMPGVYLLTLRQADQVFNKKVIVRSDQ